MAIKSISVIHGPNLNLLGEREPNHYGKFSLKEINQLLMEKAKALSVNIDIFQSNNESEIIEKIQSIQSDFIIINPAAFTHTSIAIRDAISAKKIKFIEVHISNIYAREPFRKESYFSDIAEGTISGLGAEGYVAALNYAAEKIKN